MTTCRCGCGAPIRGKRVFVDKAHQLAWMRAGGAGELNALLPQAVREAGGRTSGRLAAESGRLADASALGIARIREITAEVQGGPGSTPPSAPSGSTRS
jgi:hypothetical protein